MKKTTILITALIMLFVSAPQAKAVPMYYTFEGPVTSWGDGARAIADQMPGLARGYIVTYTIIVDLAASGTRTYYDTSVTTYTDNPGIYDYFYADAYSGDYLLEVGGGSYNADGNIAEYNYGYDYTATTGSSSYLYVNSYDEYMEIYSSSPFSGLAVGASRLYGYNKAYNANSKYSYIHSSLTLVYKSETAPGASVPEPSTLLLLGSGLLGLGMFWRMRQEG